MPRRIEHSPIGTDAAFERLPRLIVGLDDVVIDAERVGAGDELAQHRRLLEPSGLGYAAVIAGARPAELGDHDALARVSLPKLVIDAKTVIDRLRVGNVIPIGKNVCRDEVDGGREPRIVDPYVPGFAGGHRHVALAFDALDDFHQLVDVRFRLQVLESASALRRLRAQRGLPFRLVGREGPLEEGLDQLVDVLFRLQILEGASGLRRLRAQRGRPAGLEFCEERLEIRPGAFRLERCRRDVAPPAPQCLEGFGGQPSLEHRAPQGGLVADHDGVDIIVAARELARGANLRLVAVDVIAVAVTHERIVAVAVEIGVEPDAERDLQSELGRDAGHHFEPAGRRVGADGLRIGRDRLQVGADLRFGRAAFDVVGMRDALEGGVGDAGQRLVHIRGISGGLEISPQASMQARCKRDHGCDGAH